MQWRWQRHGNDTGSPDDTLMRYGTLFLFVIPANAGIQWRWQRYSNDMITTLGPRFRGDDELTGRRTYLMTDLGNNGLTRTRKVCHGWLANLDKP
jgi:hypothetical protein